MAGVQHCRNAGWGQPEHVPWPPHGACGGVGRRWEHIHHRKEEYPKWRDLENASYTTRVPSFTHSTCSLTWPFRLEVIHSDVLRPRPVPLPELHWLAVRTAIAGNGEGSSLWMWLWVWLVKDGIPEGVDNVEWRRGKRQLACTGGAN